MKALARYIVSPALCILFTLSCERDAGNVKLPEFVQKLVVTSFITPHDSASFVQVSPNVRIYGDLSSFEHPGAISVSISDGQNKTELEQSGDVFMVRRKDFRIENGKKYYLEVTSDKGLKATAECTIPKQRDLGITVDTIREYFPQPDGGTYSPIKMNVWINDPPGEENYYSFAAKVLDYNPYFGIYPYIFETYSNDDIYFSDEGRDGKRILANAVYSSGLMPDSDSTLFVFYLLHTDRNYYLWHKSLNRYSGGDNPFREISPVYSNIKGGLGIFASYTVDSIVYRYR